MSIRIRQSGGLTVALCAAETDPKPGDVYLDDGQHYALAAKFASDWRGRTISTEYTAEWAEMAKHKLRDAEEELNKWLAANGPPCGPNFSPEDGCYECWFCGRPPHRECQAYYPEDEQ